MSGQLHTKRSELLRQPPDFGARRPNFLCQFGAAYNYGWKSHEHANDAA